MVKSIWGKELVLAKPKAEPCPLATWQMLHALYTAVPLFCLLLDTMELKQNHLGMNLN